MPLPTLLIKGNLMAPNGDPILKKELEEWIPIEYIIEWFRSRRTKVGIANRVLILKSETASGKSTAFPPELYKALIKGRGENVPGIICTQPRILTTIENVNEMLKHYSKIFRRGESIGWSTHYNKLRPKSHGLLSATIGTLYQQLRTLSDNELMLKYQYILIDETHERDLQTDMTIYMLKNLLIRNQNNINCPFVVLMSATFDPESFLEYFQVPIETNFIWCGGETTGRDEMWDWNGDRTLSNYMRSAATVVEKIIDENPNDDRAQADILIFMPGRGEISQTASLLTKLNKKFATDDEKKVFSLLRLDGEAVSSQNNDYKKALIIPSEYHSVIINAKKITPSRRVIICTNVAETGLTLDNLRYVIDAGFNREIEFNPIYGIRGLLTKPAPKSRIIQRIGRAGRKHRGVFYPLYPRYIYDSLPKLQFPQILINDISAIMLDLINEQLKFKWLKGEQDPQFLITDIDMVDVPTPDALGFYLEKLYTIGFISPIAPKWGPSVKEIINAVDDAGRFSITRLGALATTFNLISPECVRMILAAYSWNVSIMDIITIAAYMSLDLKSIVAAAEVDPEHENTNPKVYIGWATIYKMGLPGWASGVGMLYKNRLLIADDFIDGLILFNAIKYIIYNSTPREAITNLKKWCSVNHISYKGALDLIRVRDDLIEQMLTAGFEILSQEDRALYKSSAEDFMDILTQIKYCIYDGFRNNILIHDGTVYKTTTGLEVMTPKLFREDERKMAEKTEYGFVIDAMPKALLYRELSLKYSQKTSMYVVKVDQISCLDGFVSYDLEFTI